MFLGNKASSTNKSHKYPSKKNNSNSTHNAKLRKIKNSPWLSCFSEKSDNRSSYERLEYPESSESSPELNKNKKKKTSKEKELPNSSSMSSDRIGKDKRLESESSSSHQNPIKPQRQLKRSSHISAKEMAMYEQMKS